MWIFTKSFYYTEHWFEVIRCLTTEESLTGRKLGNKLYLLNKSKQNHSFLFFIWSHLSIEGQAKDCVTQRSSRDWLLFWNALILIVSMQSTALCRTERLVLSTTTGHIRPSAHETSPILWGQVENSGGGRHLWHSLEHFEDTWRQFAMLEMQSRLTETNTNHKQKTGSCSFIEVIFEPE